MKVVVTGFDPFWRRSNHPAFEAVKNYLLKLQELKLLKLRCQLLFGTSGEKVAEAIETHQPDMVICVGQAGGRETVTAEKWRLI